MSDLEPLVAHLREDVTRAEWLEPREIRARGARRTVRQAVGATAAAVVAVAAVAVGAATVGTAHHPVLPPGGTPTPTVRPHTPSPAPSLSTGPSTDPQRAAGTGLSTVTDFTFVSPTEGWLLGAKSCNGTGCAAVVHTTDGGHTWHELPALPPDVPVTAQSGVPALNAHLRFANGQTGYLFSGQVFYLTRDGGRTWTKQAGHADALELANGTAIRVISTTGCTAGCQSRIERAPVGTDQWQTVLSPPNFSGRVQLQRTGHRVFVAFYGRLAGGVPAYATVLTSTDDGSTWTTRSDPCAAHATGEAVATSMAVADDGSLTVLCYVRVGPGSQSTFVVTSTDAGTSFGPERPTRAPGLAVGAASAGTVLVSVFEQSSLRLYRSTDGGRTWTVVATAPERIGAGTVPDGAVAFENVHNGWWLPGVRTVFHTTDGGAAWTAS